MIEKILGIVATFFIGFSVFLCLFVKKQKDDEVYLKEENQKLKDENAEQSKINNALQESKKAGDESRKNNAKTKNKIHGDNGTESFSAISDVLCDK